MSFPYFDFPERLENRHDVWLSEGAKGIASVTTIIPPQSLDRGL